MFLRIRNAFYKLGLEIRVNDITNGRDYLDIDPKLPPHGISGSLVKAVKAYLQTTARVKDPKSKRRALERIDEILEEAEDMFSQWPQISLFGGAEYAVFKEYCKVTAANIMELSYRLSRNHRDSDIHSVLAKAKIMNNLLEEGKGNKNGEEVRELSV